MSGIPLVPATIWKFQIVRFGEHVRGNYLVIPDSSSTIENTGKDFNSAGIANGAILDRIVDASKTIRDFVMITGGMSHAIT
ncbi:MAG: hypothetical protein WCX22_00590 [Methanoregula sp.]